MSGSALSPWAMVREPARFARQVAKHANCSPELPHPHLLKCLRERPLDALLSTPIDVPEFSTAFGPSVDGVVIDNGNPESRSSSNQGTFFTCFLWTMVWVTSNSRNNLFLNITKIVCKLLINNINIVSTTDIKRGCLCLIHLINTFVNLKLPVYRSNDLGLKI